MPISIKKTLANSVPKPAELGRVALRLVNLSEMNPAPYNPRDIAGKAKHGLSNSLNKFGLVQPIVWNERSGNIVGGHQRYNDLKEKGVTETDVVVVNLDDITEKELNMTLNNKGIEGHFTQGALAILKEIEEIKGLDDYLGLQFDGLEQEIMKSYNVKPTAEFNGEPLEDLEPSPIGDDTPADSHVKQVQLFLNTETFPLFQEMVQALQKRYMTDNPSDTVMLALRSACDAKD